MPFALIFMSRLFFLESLAERMRWIDTDDFQHLGEEGEFLQRERQAAVVRMALDVDIELGREKTPLDHVALELGHIDAVGGETAERLVERGRHVAHPEQESGDDLAFAVACPFFLTREHNEA